MLTPLDRLKIAREDYDQQEKLNQTLGSSARFYVGICTILGSWNLSMWVFDSADWLMLIATVAFWAILLVAVYNLFMFFRGEYWAWAPTLHEYLKYEQDCLKDPDPDKATEKMMTQMAGDYAEFASINKVANLTNQRRIRRIGYVLMFSLLALGAQKASGIIGGHGETAKHVGEPTSQSTCANEHR